MWAALQAIAGDPDADEEDREKATRDLALLAEFGGFDPNRYYGPEVKAKLLGALFASGSRYAAVMITDVCDLTDRINSPGTVGPHNWSFRLTAEQEDLALREMETMKPLLADGRRG
jgi:4-alpha-glucanotransferase